MFSGSVFRIPNWIAQIPPAEAQSTQALAEHSQSGHFLFGLLWHDPSGQLPGTLAAYILPGRPKTVFYYCSPTIHYYSCFFPLARLSMNQVENCGQK